MIYMYKYLDIFLLIFIMYIFKNLIVKICLFLFLRIFYIFVFFVQQGVVVDVIWEIYEINYSISLKNNIIRNKFMWVRVIYGNIGVL